jgi:membrane protein
MWAVVERLLGRDLKDRTGRVRKRVLLPTYGLRLLLAVIRQWRRDRAPQLAAALSFQTALSLVPLLAVALALVHASGAAEIEQKLVDYISEQLAPVGQLEVGQHLTEWIHNARFSTAGVLGVVVLVGLGYLTVMRVENIFNDIWRSERRRKLAQRFVVFYAIFTLVPALFGASLILAARAGLTRGATAPILALASAWGAFALANKLLPSAPVRWKSALVAGLLSALFFELAKMLFGAYVVHVAFARYMGIYGPLALLPILLLWVYYTWLVVLLGAEVAYAMQHLSELELYDRRGGRLEAHLDERVNGQVATRVMVAIARGWRAGQPIDRETLMRSFELAPEAIDRLLRRLTEAHLVIQVQESDEAAYVPARPPAEITLADVFAPFRDGDVVRPGARAASRQPLDQVLTRLEESRRSQLESITVGALAVAESTDPPVT